MHLNALAKLSQWIHSLKMIELRNLLPIFISSSDFKQEEWHSLCSGRKIWQMLLKAATLKMQLWSSERNFKSFIESCTAKTCKIQMRIGSERGLIFFTVVVRSWNVQPKIWLHNRKTYIRAKDGTPSWKWLAVIASCKLMISSFCLTSEAEACYYYRLISMQVIS